MIIISIHTQKLKLNYLFGILLFLSCWSCQNAKPEGKSDQVTKTISTDLDFDHFNIWVENPILAKEKLIDIGFTAVSDSLSDIHKGQGTTGRYFHFLNSYLELIFVYDQKELEENNRINKELDFTERANFAENGALPFSIALKLKDYDIEKIPFEKIRYHQDWMDKGLSIYTAKNSKKYLREPSIFVVYPELESTQFNTLADVENIPDEYAFARAFYKHPNGVKKLTKIIITSTDLNLNTATMQTVNSIENLTVRNGTEYLMELYFDNSMQGKSFDLRPELPLKVYL